MTARSPLAPAARSTGATVSSRSSAATAPPPGVVSSDVTAWIRVLVKGRSVAALPPYGIEIRVRARSPAAAGTAGSGQLTKLTSDGIGIGHATVALDHLPGAHPSVPFAVPGRSRHARAD